MVFIHLAEGFEEIEAITVVDLLRRANIECRTISVTDSKIVKGAHGIPVEADMLFDASLYNGCDAIVLPGGMPGTLGLKEHEGLRKQLLAFVAEKKMVAAICAAPMVLGSLGILDGIEATMYPGMEEHLGEKAIHKNEKVVISDNIITSQGPGTAMDFALTLIRLIVGSEKETEIKKGLLLI